MIHKYEQTYLKIKCIPVVGNDTQRKNPKWFICVFYDNSNFQVFNKYKLTFFN